MNQSNAPKACAGRVAAPIVGAASCDLQAAVALLRRGEILGIPTETVYGLGADATNGLACARIFEAKGRPSFNPLIAHCASLEMALGQGVFSKKAIGLAEAFWPGALTLVVRRHPASAVADLVTAGLDTIAIRVPDAPIMRALIEGLGAPIAAPSANRSGHVSATTALAVAEDLGGSLALIIDAGPSPVGVESTIVDMSGKTPVLLRPGGLARADIEAVLGEPLDSPTHPAGDRPSAPGMLAAHYAPSCPVRLEAAGARPGEGLIAFGPGAACGPGGSGGPGDAVRIVNLSPGGDLREAAANLFAALRSLDAAGVAGIAVMPIPATGLGEAINDRLRRAALGRLAETR